MSPIIVVIQLMSVSEMKPKWLPVSELLRILRSTAVYEISSCNFAFLLINCDPTFHYFHHIFGLLHKKYLNIYIIFSPCLYHSNITDLFIFKVSINKVSRNSFRPVSPLLDQSCRIDTFGLDICNAFGDKKSTVQYNSLP